jgi:hypothetical protein
LNKMLSCASGLLAGGLLLASTSGVRVEEPLAISDAFGVNLVEEPLANHTFEWGNVQPQRS